MRTLIFILLLSFNINAAEFGYSFMNGHIIAESPEFKNKIDKNGILMYNPIINYTDGKYTFFIGKDSINQTIIGSLKNYHYSQKMSFVIGGYLMNRGEWRKADLTCLNLKLTRNYGFIPVIGVKFSQHLEHFSIYELITPATFSIGISLKLD